LEAFGSRRLHQKTKKATPSSGAAFLVFGGGVIEPAGAGEIDAQGRANAAGGRMPGAAKPPSSSS